MKHSFGISELLGFAVTSLLGTVLHFLYDLLGGALWIAPFSGVNESTWEHMKLLFWPMLLFAAVQSLFFRERDDFWCVKLCGILLGLALIPFLFYGYNSVIGRSPDWLNIAIFFISAAIAYVTETLLYSRGTLRAKCGKISIVILCIIAILFIVFTFHTPKLAIFRDPMTGTYGI